MAKSKTFYVCSECGARFSTWAGKCGNCEQWNTITEESGESSTYLSEPADLQALDQIKPTKSGRIVSNIIEFDRVLGSDDPGSVPGSVILLAGSPGVGKSTLLLQVAQAIAGAIYFSAEESAEQIYLRANRIGLSKSKLRISSERDLNKIIATIKHAKTNFVVIDSIQTVFDDTIAGTPGSLIQVRDNTWRLQQIAKQLQITILIVSHVTKEGVVSGPKVLEHLVDVVLYLEGDRRTGLRMLRPEKNRYGPTDEVGIWTMTASGLSPVDDPGKLFEELIGDDVPGRALTIAHEGSRAFVVEVQALVTKTSFGYPKRGTQGFDSSRLAVLLAVMENRLELPLSQYDVYVNIVGGFTLKDTGIDLAVVAAILSSFNKKSLPGKLVFVGEIGLLGELRPSFNQPRRAKEASRLGYEVQPKFKSLKALPVLLNKLGDAI